jgi:hypothetical protein
MERAGARAGRPRQPAETISEYALAVDGLSHDGQGGLGRLAAEVSASAYGERPLSAETGRRAVAEIRNMSRRRT